MENEGYKTYSDEGEHNERVLNEVVVEQHQTQSESSAEEPIVEPKRSGIAEFLMLMLTGNILTRREVSKYYSHMIAIATLFFISIMVLFGSLHLDVRHNQLAEEVQMLRERSVRLKEVRSERTSQPAVLMELHSRGIKMDESKIPAIVIE